MKKTDNPFIMVYPDPVLNMDMLSASTFLYFQKPIALTLPPVAIIKESYDILSIIESRNPEWKAKFDYIFKLWRYQHDCYGKVMNILEPLKDKYIKSTWTVYPANTDAMNRVNQLIKSANLDIDSVYNMINPTNASGEIIRHIMLEAYLENGKNINALFEYCGEFFNKEPLQHLLTKGYLLRMNLLKYMSDTTPILLTNPVIWDNIFKPDLSVTDNNNDRIDQDVISWEIFRQIISPYLDPLDKAKVGLLEDILNNRREEIDRLKLKCYALAEKIKPEIKYNELGVNVETLIKREVQNEVSDLLKLDKNALEDLFFDIFSDEKTWMAIATFIGGVVGGNISITTGGAISALSFIGSKSVKAMGSKNQELRKNDYGLVYTISRKVK